MLENKDAVFAIVKMLNLSSNFQFLIISHNLAKHPGCLTHSP